MLLLQLDARPDEVRHGVDEALHHLLHRQRCGIYGWERAQNRETQTLRYHAKP